MAQTAGESDTTGFDRTARLRDGARRRVELAPAHRCVDVIPCCGPDGTFVLVDAYIDRGSLFLTVHEAAQLADAIHAAAVITRRGEREQ